MRPLHLPEGVHHRGLRGLAAARICFRLRRRVALVRLDQVVRAPEVAAQALHLLLLLGHLGAKRPHLRRARLLHLAQRGRELLAPLGRRLLARRRLLLHRLQIRRKRGVGSPATAPDLGEGHSRLRQRVNQPRRRRAHVDFAVVAHHHRGDRLLARQLHVAGDPHWRRAVDGLHQLHEALQLARAELDEKGSVDHARAPIAVLADLHPLLGHAPHVEQRAHHRALGQLVAPGVRQEDVHDLLLRRGRHLVQRRRLAVDGRHVPRPRAKLPSHHDVERRRLARLRVQVEVERHRRRLQRAVLAVGRVSARTVDSLVGLRHKAVLDKVLAERERVYLVAVQHRRRQLAHVQRLRHSEQLQQSCVRRVRCRVQPPREVVSGRRRSPVHTHEGVSSVVGLWVAPRQLQIVSASVARAEDHLQDVVDVGRRALDACAAQQLLQEPQHPVFRVCVHPQVQHDRTHRLVHRQKRVLLLVRLVGQEEGHRRQRRVVLRRDGVLVACLERLIQLLQQGHVCPLQPAAPVRLGLGYPACEELDHVALPVGQVLAGVQGEARVLGQEGCRHQHLPRAALFLSEDDSLSSLQQQHDGVPCQARRHHVPLQGHHSVVDTVQQHFSLLLITGDSPVAFAGVLTRVY